MLDLIVLHGEFSLFTVRGNFWYQIYQNQRQKILCQLMALITNYIDYQASATFGINIIIFGGQIFLKCVQNSTQGGTLVFKLKNFENNVSLNLKIVVPKVSSC